MTNVLPVSTLNYHCDLFCRPVPSLGPSRQFSPDVFVITHFRRSTLRFSFFFSAVYFWNSLPVNEASSKSLGFLKVRLFKHLFTDKGKDCAVSAGHCSRGLVSGAF